MSQLVNNICLSSSVILRCLSYSTEEYAVLLIPPALQLLFALCLVVLKWGNGMKHYLLAAEGFFTMAVATIDFVSRALLPNGESLTLFKGLDIAVGSLSFLQLVLYLLFLYLIARSHLVPMLPSQLQFVMNATLALFIPAVAVVNEVGSFIGIAYGKKRNEAPVRFSSQTQYDTWLLFNTTTIVLLAIFQMIIFSFLFLKISTILGKKRSTGLNKSPSEAVAQFHGVGWMAAGVFIGAAEVSIGFASDFFMIDIARRSLRCVSRLFIMVAAFKGMDSIDDFYIISNRPLKRSSSSRLGMISNPVGGSFRNQRSESQYAAFYTHPREAPTTMEKPFVPEKVQIGPSRGYATRSVDLLYDGHSPPKLHIRQSKLGRSVRESIFGPSRPLSSPQYRKTLVSSLPSPTPKEDIMPQFDDTPERSFRTSRPSSQLFPVSEGPSFRASAATSMSSMPLPTVHELVSQFPDTPPVQPGQRAIRIPKAMEDPEVSVLPDTNSIMSVSTTASSSHLDHDNYSWDGTGTTDSQIFLQRSESLESKGVTEDSASKYTQSAASHYVPEERPSSIGPRELLLHRRLQHVPPPIRVSNDASGIFDGVITVVSAGASTPTGPQTGRASLPPPLPEEQGPSFFHMTPDSTATRPGFRGSTVSGVPVSPSTSGYPSWYGSQSGAEDVYEQDTALGRIASRFERLPTAYASYFVMGGSSMSIASKRVSAVSNRAPRPHPFAAAGARQSGYIYSHNREPSLPYDRNSTLHEEVDRSSQMSNTFPRSVSRIKALGRVANHRTPTPNHSEFDRRSMATEWDSTPGSGGTPFITRF